MELYYPSSENKDAYQLRGYREADLRLCFRICRLLVFPCGGSYFRYMRTPLVLELFSTDEARDRLRRLQEAQDATLQPGQLRTNR